MNTARTTSGIFRDSLHRFRDFGSLSFPNLNSGKISQSVEMPALLRFVGRSAEI